MFINKKYIYLFAGVAGLLIILIVFLVSTQQPSQPSQIAKDASVPQTGQQDQSRSPESAGIPIIATQMPIPTVAQVSPEEAAKSFYLWYVNHPAPLTSRAYENMREITTEYKEIMTDYVTRGIDPKRDPVFNCNGGLPKNIVAQAAVLDYSRTLALVDLQEATTGRKLYLIKLQKDAAGSWLIRDVWCPR